VVTSRAPVAARVKSLRSHGVGEDGACEVTGCNSRLDALQAVVLGVKLAHLEAWTRARIAAAARYHELLEPLRDELALPAPAPAGAHVYNQFVVRTPRRAALAAFLADHGVASRAYYTRPLHREPCFAGLDEALLPHTDEASETTLAIPIYPEITADQQAYVATAIAAFFRG
jgi:dTDP-4-amino-4,6-dideoxygalactose transaminase